MLCSHRWTGGAPAVRAACRSLHSAPICRCRAEPQQQKDTEDSERGGLRALLRERWAEVAQHERVLAVMASTALMMSGHGVMTPVLPLLADSLTGDALTALFVCVSQAPDNVMQSKIALEFGEVFSKLTVSCHDIIAAIWVAFFSRWQRYRC